MSQISDKFGNFDNAIKRIPSLEKDQLINKYLQGNSQMGDSKSKVRKTKAQRAEIGKIKSPIQSPVKYIYAY